MRTGLAAAVIVAAAITQTAATQQARGVVTSVTVQPGNGVGVYNFIIRGQNPCGAVRLDPGEGGGITHPIHALPTTLVHDFTRTGNFTVRAEGMGNCDGDVTTTVNVTRVRPRPTPDPPPPPPPPVPTAPTTTGRTPRMNTDWSEARFNAIDVNNDNRITISEWRFGPDEFTRVDRNRDSAIVYREFARGAEGQPAQPNVPDGPRGPGDAIVVSARMPWTDSGISVRAGDLVVIRAGGEIQWAPDVNAKAGPNGVGGRPAANRAPVPMADLGALVGRIGTNGAPFVIGNMREPFRVPTAGRLYLGVNDDVLSDNDGEFYVAISTGRSGLASSPQPTPGNTRNPANTDWSEARFYALDRNSDGRITMNEWRFGAEEFARVDRNNDDVIVLREYTRGADGQLPATQAGTRAIPPGSIVVSAKTAWTDSGVSVRAGDFVSIRSEGVIQWGPGSSATAGPGGVSGRAASSRAPVPAGEHGALIGRIGNGRPFVIGNRQDSFQVPNAGRLYLGVNDDNLFDNDGEFIVRVSIGRSAR